jgi:type II secretory pathway component PulF
VPAAAERNIDSAGESRKFNYRARRSEGGDMVRGVVEAVDHASAVRELRRQGLAILSVELGDLEAAVGQESDPVRLRKRLARAMGKDDVVSFCQQLAVMLRTGVPLAESLETFAEQASKKDVAEFVGSFLKRQITGANLDQSRSPACFSSQDSKAICRGGLHCNL